MSTEATIPSRVGVLGGGRMGAGIAHGFAWRVPPLSWWSGISSRPKRPGNVSRARWPPWKGSWVPGPGCPATRHPCPSPRLRKGCSGLNDSAGCTSSIRFLRPCWLRWCWGRTPPPSWPHLPAGGWRRWARPRWWSMTPPGLPPPGLGGHRARSNPDGGGRRGLRRGHRRRHGPGLQVPRGTTSTDGHGGPGCQARGCRVPALHPGRAVCPAAAYEEHGGSWGARPEVRQGVL